MGHLQPVRMIHITLRLRSSSPLFPRVTWAEGTVCWAVLLEAARQFSVPWLSGNYFLDVMPVLSMVPPISKSTWSRLYHWRSLEKSASVCSCGLLR